MKILATVLALVVIVVVYAADPQPPLSSQAAEISNTPPTEKAKDEDPPPGAQRSQATGGSSGRSFGLSGSPISFIPECSEYSRGVCIKYGIAWTWQKFCPTRWCWFRPKYGWAGKRRFEIYQSSNYPPKVYKQECRYPLSPCWTPEFTHQAYCYNDKNCHNNVHYDVFPWCPKKRCQFESWKKKEMWLWVFIKFGDITFYLKLSVTIQYRDGCTCRYWTKPTLTMTDLVKEPTRPTLPPQPTWSTPTRTTDEFGPFNDWPW